MRRYYVIGGVVTAVIVLVGIGLYLIGGGGEPGAPSSGNGFFERLSRGVATLTHVATPAEMAEAPEFAFRRLEIDTTKPQAEACLVFTRDLDASGRTHYEDYLSIDPQTSVVVRVVDSRVCIAGLEFNATYNVTLKTGLPDAAGDKLVEDETVPVELRDKPVAGALLRRHHPAARQCRWRAGHHRQHRQAAPEDHPRRRPAAVADRKRHGRPDHALFLERQASSRTTRARWSGTARWMWRMSRTTTVVTLIPIHDILKGKQPGAYVLIARTRPRPKALTATTKAIPIGMAAQWVIDSDIALTTFQGANGLTVFARSYASAEPMSGVKLTLVARNNNILPTVTTDSDGRADFDAGLFPRHGRRRAGRRDGLWRVRRFQLPRSAPSGLRSDRPRRRRPRNAGPGRCLSLYRARRLSPRRDGPDHRDAARPRRRGRHRAADVGCHASRRPRSCAHDRCRCIARGRRDRVGVAAQRPRAAWPLADRGLYRSRRPIRSAACSSMSPISCRSV